MIVRQTVSHGDMAERKRKQLEDAHENITKAYRRVINADMSAPYCYIEHPQTKQQLWFTLGVPYHWEDEGTRFKVEEKTRVEDLAMQAGGKVVYIEKEDITDETNNRNA